MTLAQYLDHVCLFIIAFSRVFQAENTNNTLVSS